MADGSTIATPGDSRPAVAGWLGLLLVLVISLNTLGGWVRLSGCGVAIPSWPAIPIGEGRWTVLPPVTAQGWDVVQQAYEVDQQRLQARVAAGELHAANRGRIPRDAAEFKVMFLTEWSHRLLAALVGIITAACVVVVFRHRDLRRRLGAPLGIGAALIVVQAMVGGLLVNEGTSTNWLFLHQGNAGLILICLTVACLRLVAPAIPAPSDGTLRRRRNARLVLGAALAATWVQMIFGALVAGSRHGNPFSTDFPGMFGSLVPAGLWDGSRGIGANLLDNAILHQFVHRWWAGLVTALILGAWWLAVRSQSGERARLSLAIAATFLGCEVILGIAAVVLAHGDGTSPPVLALAHQLSAGCLLISLAMGAFWLRHEGEDVAGTAVPTTPPVASMPTSPARPLPALRATRIGLRRVGRYAADLLVLMKYRITLTAMFTGYVALVVEGHHHADLPVLLPTLAAMALFGGTANTLNQIFERHRDEVMTRTRKRRPLPDGRISLRAAWIFAGSQFAIAQFLALAVLGSPMGAWLGALLVVYYSFFYTLWLKPRHWLNIVIGGVPGAMGPPLAYGLATGTMAWAPVAMFALIFLWTPPHVWALAIRLKDDYARAGIPMLPVVKGVDETARQIFWYTLVMVVGSLLLPFTVPATATSWVYIALAVAGGAIFLGWSLIVWFRRPMPATMPLFRYSIIYIFALFIGLMVDALRARGEG